MRCGYNALLFTASARRARINSEKRQELAGVDKNATALIGNRKYKYSAEARKTRARARANENYKANTRKWNKKENVSLRVVSFRIHWNIIRNVLFVLPV